MTTKQLWLLIAGKTIRCLRAGTRVDASHWNREIRLTGKQGRWVRVRGLPAWGNVEDSERRYYSLHGSQPDQAESSPFPSLMLDGMLLGSLLLLVRESRELMGSRGTQSGET